jgi:hypothetical protein
MLFYLFIAFQILYSISCDISCYQAPFDTNTFDYIVTPDHFPEELEESSLEVNSVQCSITVSWEQNPNRTVIELIADNNTKAGSIEHQLQVDVGYVSELETSPTPRWTKNINYQCNTNQCNSLSQLKRLLQALIVNDSLDDLTYLLKPVEKFQGKWCYRGSNITSGKCNTTIPVSSCTQCEVSATMNQAGTELCATCSTEYPSQSILKYQKTFNMTDRTNSSTCYILCGRENCSTPAVTANIREKIYIGFNFTTFLNAGSANTTFLNAGSVNKINSLCMFFFNEILILLFMRSTLFISEFI